MSYGTVRLPPPNAGRYLRWSCAYVDRTDDGAVPAIVGGTIVMVGAPMGITATYVEGEHGWALVLTVAAVVITLAFLLPLLIVRLRAVRVPGSWVSSSAPTWWPRDFEPEKTWRQYRRLQEPVLRSVAGPLWWAFLTAMHAYSVGGSREHVEQAEKRAKRIALLAKEQREIDAARALARAGGGVVDTDDLERADNLLRALRELERA